MAQCQDNVTESGDIGIWWPGHPVGQHYKVIMNAHCHKSVPVRIRHLMLPGHTYPTTNYLEGLCPSNNKGYIITRAILLEVRTYADFIVLVHWDIIPCHNSLRLYSVGSPEYHSINQSHYY